MIAVAAPPPLDESRRDLLALNTNLRRKGAPAIHFGAEASLSVGLVISSRPQLCILGAHRHFLSEASYTAQL